MKLQFDSDLIEATHLAVNPVEDPARDRIYTIKDPQERDEAFRQHSIRWFQRAGFEAVFTDAFAEWPHVTDHCTEAVVKRVRNARDEFAELFRTQEGQCRVGIGLRARRLAEKNVLPLLRHELCHLNDMLDPCFGYPDEIPNDVSPSAQIERDRYRVLWDIAIDSRLQRRHPDCLEFTRADEMHRIIFDRTFGFLPDDEKECLYADLCMDTVTHALLWEFASDPRHLRENGDRPALGSACPLCGFSTFAWAEEKIIDQATTAIVLDFPSWQSEQGACLRCAEVYRAITTTKLPPTILAPRRSAE